MNKVNNNNQATPSAFCKWKTEDIFSANLMFPTIHFQSLEDFENADLNDVMDIATNLLNLCQPISESCKKELVSGVRSGNKLRIYYQAMKYATAHLQVIQTANENGTDHLPMTDDNLYEAFEGRGYEVLDEIIQEVEEISDQDLLAMAYADLVKN